MAQESHFLIWLKSGKKYNKTLAYGIQNPYNGEKWKRVGISGRNSG